MMAETKLNKTRSMTMAELTNAVIETESRVSAVEETTKRIEQTSNDIKHTMDLMRQEAAHDRKSLQMVYTDVYKENGIQDTIHKNCNEIQDLKDFRSEVKSIGKWIILTGGGVIIVALMNLIMK